MAGDSTSEEVADIVSGVAAAKPRRARGRRVKATDVARTGLEPGDSMPGWTEDMASDDPDDAGDEADDGAEPSLEASDGMPQVTQEEIDDIQTRTALGPLPKPVENVKTLDDLMAKYNIGEDPAFSAQVHRTYPKYFPGGRKADGFYDEWYEPITQEKLLSEYGGGVYSIRIMGPNPTKPNHKKHYDSIQVSLAGDAKVERVPRALQHKEPENPAAAAATPGMQVPMYQQQEPPKLAEAALKMVQSAADAERNERHRVEDRAAAAAAAAETARQAAAAQAIAVGTPLADAERRRADDLIAAEREKSKSEREWLQAQLTAKDEAFRRLEERLDTMEHSRPSIGQELKDVASVFAPRGEDNAGRMGQQILENVLSKHATEMDAMRKQQGEAVESIHRQHQQSVDSMRASHEQALLAARSAHTAELQARAESHARAIEVERETMARRDQRFEDQLKSEREERRRDQEMYKSKLEDNDRVWKERLESQRATVDSAWEHRHASSVATFENRILWLQQEGDRLRTEIVELKSKAVDTSDPIAILHKARDVREAIGMPEASPTQVGSSGGIGLSGGSDLMGILEVAGEKLPGVLEGLGSLLRGNQQPQQPVQYHEGQIVAMQDGQPGVVVPDGHGGWAVTPKAAYDAHQAALAAQAKEQQGRGLPTPGRTAQQQPRVMPSPSQMPPRQQPQKRKNQSVTPNLAKDMPGMAPLPKQRPPWEGEEDAEQQAAPEPQRRTSRQPPQPRQQPQQPPQPQQEAAVQKGRTVRAMGGLSPVEEQGLKTIARLVHQSVLAVDEPEEFVAKVTQQFPVDVLKHIVGNYSPEDIAHGIAQIEPASAGATAEGQKFVRDAFKLIHEHIGQG